MTTSMRAITVAAFGSPLVLDSVERPEPLAGHEVLDVVFASVNPLDIWVSRGNFATLTPLPQVPGVEGVARRADGSHVLVGGVGVVNWGTYAEAVRVPSAGLIPVPVGVDLHQAASITVAGITAWMCNNALAEITASDTVLVLGASGGVGAVSVQLARNAGATVLGQTSSAGKGAAIEANGASVVVAPTAASLKDALGGRVPSVVIDGLGGEFTGACVDLVGTAGRIVNFGTSADTAVAFDMRTFYRKGTRLFGYAGLLLTPEKRDQAYASLFADIAAGTLSVPIDDVLPLGDAGEAHRRILDKQVQGKLLLDPSK